MSRYPKLFFSCRQLDPIFSVVFLLPGSKHVLMRPNKTYHISLLTHHSTEEWCLGDRALGEGMFAQCAIISHNPPVLFQILHSVFSCDLNNVLLVDVKLRITWHSLHLQRDTEISTVCWIFKNKNIYVNNLCMYDDVRAKFCFRLVHPLGGGAYRHI